VVVQATLIELLAQELAVAAASLIAAKSAKVQRTSKCAIF
jgi:hypothetical protein